MSKTVKIVIAIIVIILIALVGIFTMNSSEETNENINVANEINAQNNIGDALPETEDLTELVNNIYEHISDVEFPKLETTEIDLTDSDLVTMYTGLENGNDLEKMVVSQPLMSSQAYSFVIAKVKSGANADEIAKKMSEQVDTRRWVCVEAEKLYATSSGNIVCLIMADDEKAEAVYTSFKSQVGTVGEEYEKTAEQEDLPLDEY